MGEVAPGNGWGRSLESTHLSRLPILPLTCCMILDKALNLSVPQFPLETRRLDGL